MAVKPPIVPTMKYWNTLFTELLELLLYLPKSGILSVELDPIPLKGLSKEDEPETSEMSLRCWVETAVDARKGVN
jgi:hypothetical protein